MLTKKLFKLVLLGLVTSAIFIIGCATVKLADIPATAEPRAEIAKLDEEINVAITKNIDVLSEKEFNKSKSFLAKAKKDMEKEQPQSEILDSLRKGKGYLNEAYSKAGDREGKASGLFAARQMALQAGAGSMTELKDDLKSLDSKVSDKADELDNTKADTLADYQNQYVELERRSVILSQLGKAQAMVNGAEKGNAKTKAPETFKKAELSLKTAESIISTNVRNPDGYQGTVLQANNDATQLTDVMAIIKQNGNNLKENVAIKMVDQKKEISGLEKNLTDAAAQGAADQSAMQLKNEQLSSENELKDQALNESKNKIQTQQAIEQARSQFSDSEAEAYQQGENLVIRLKQINFASGKSDLPANAIPLLSKVLDVAKTLNASQIKVEGHTDSVGSESKNKTISENRAAAVATYFKSNGLANIDVESEGYGFKNPIATNKSSAGRAQNRRVDVIIAPNTLIK